jgi:hypothetical protein
MSTSVIIIRVRCMDVSSVVTYIGLVCGPVGGVLTTTYFMYDGAFYDQNDVVAMGSPLAPVIASYYMEHFEQQAISRAPRKPIHWYRYVDDTFVVWPHGEEELREFLDHLNSIHHNIKFTMEVGKKTVVAFS